MEGSTQNPFNSEKGSEVFNNFIKSVGEMSAYINENVESIKTELQKQDPQKFEQVWSENNISDKVQELKDRSKAFQEKFRKY